MANHSQVNSLHVGKVKNKIVWKTRLQTVIKIVELGLLIYIALKLS